MRLDFASHHLTRRDALKLGGAAWATAVGATLENGQAGAVARSTTHRREAADPVYNDEMFDVASVIAAGSGSVPTDPTTNGEP